MLFQLTERKLLCNSGINVKMSMKHRCKGTDGGRTKYLERNKVQCHFFHLKSHTEWLGIKRQLPCKRSATKYLILDTAFLLWDQSKWYLTYTAHRTTNTLRSHHTEQSYQPYKNSPQMPKFFPLLFFQTPGPFPFPNFYLVCLISLPAGRAVTAWEHSEQ